VAVIADSARKHGISDKDIIHAYRNAFQADALDEGVTLLIGTDFAGRFRPHTQDQVMEMAPRTVEEILAHADVLANRIEADELGPGRPLAPEPLRALGVGIADLASAQRQVADAVAAAREAGYPWALIGTIIGTSGEAARQRYGKRASTR